MQFDMRWERREQLIREEEREEGREEGRAESVIQLLVAYGEIPEKIKKRVYAEHDTEVLNQMLRDAAGCQGMQKFEDKWC